MALTDLVDKLKKQFSLQNIREQAQALPQYTRQTPFAQSLRTILNKPAPNNAITRGLIKIATPLEQPLRQYGTGFTQASTFGLASPKTQPITNFGEALGYGVGFGAGMLNPLNPVNKFGIWNKIGQVGARPTSAILSRIAPKAGGFVAKKLIPSIASEAAQTGAYGIAKKALGQPFNWKTDLAIGLAARGGLGKFQPDLPVKANFTMDTKTLNEVVDASDMMRFPNNFIGKIKTGAKTKKEALKVIQKMGAEAIERISARHLPDKQLTTLKSSLAKADALLNLNRENKLANVNVGYLVEKKPTQASKGVSAQPPFYDTKGLDNAYSRYAKSMGISVEEAKARLRGGNYQVPTKTVKPEVKDYSNITLYHGTNADKFTEFNPDKFGNPATRMRGTYFTTDPESAADFGGNIVKAKANIKKPLIIDGSEAPQSVLEIQEELLKAKAGMGTDLTDYVLSGKIDDYDAIVIKGANYAGAKSFDEVIVTNPKAIKIEQFGNVAQGGLSELQKKGLGMGFAGPTQASKGVVGEQFEGIKSIINKSKDVDEMFTHGSYGTKPNPRDIDVAIRLKGSIDNSRSLIDEIKNYTRQFSPIKGKDGGWQNAVDITFIDNTGKAFVWDGIQLRPSKFVPVPPTQASKGVTRAVENMPEVSKGLELPQKAMGFVSSSSVRTQPSPLSQTPQTLRIGKQVSSEDIIAQGRKQIGSTQGKPNKSLEQTASDIYTQWVDRYNPITKASEKAKSFLKIKGAELRPEADPSVLVRKLTGAGGIADYKYRTELKPIVDQMDNLKIDKLDMDVYLANKRLAGFGDIGREVKGADPVKSKQIVEALEAKYGTDISQVADQLYKYQNKGFQEMVDAGFISPEVAKTIRSQNPDYAPLNRVMDEVDNYLGLPTRKTMQGAQPIFRLKGSERKIDSPIENIIANTFKQRAAIEKNNVAKGITNLQQVADLGFSKVSKSGNDTITIWNNGNKEYWKVGEEIATTAKGLNEENMNALLKLFTAPARLLRQGATGRNPEFMIPNVVRDQLDAGITSRYGYVPFIDYLSGLKSMVTNDDVYQRWQRSGAKIDLGEMSGRKTIQASFDKTLGKKRLFGWVGSVLDTMGKYSEQPTRVGLFKKAYKKTGNELLAMMESRDATVDFARMGSKMKVANSIVPFLNVGVQGFDKLIRATKNNPARVALNATIYGALPATMVTLYNLANHSDEYAEIPQYEKDSNFVLVKGRNESGTVSYISIPKGNVLPLISNPIQSFLEFIAQNSQQTFGEFATKFLSSALPVVGEGQSLKEVGVKTIGSNLPQLVKPITENLMNKSFWKYNTDTEQTKEIVPTYLQKKAPYEQSYEWTPKAYKAVGAVLDVSPLQVQNLMEGYLAGYTKIPAQLIDAAFSLSKGEPVDTNQMTILRRFIKETYPSSSKKPVVQQESPGLMERITGKVAASEGELPTVDNDFKILYEDAQNKIEGYKDLSSKIRTGLKDTQTLPEAQTELVEAKNLVRRMEIEQPEKVYQVGLDVYESGGGKTTLERADWAEKWLNKSQDQAQFDSWYQGMLDKGVMTKSVLEELRERGMNLSMYTEGGKIKTFSSGKAKKAKKITIKKVSVKPIKLTKSKGITIQSIKLPKAPNLKRITVKAIKITGGVNKVPQYKIKTIKNTLTSGFAKLA